MSYCPFISFRNQYVSEVHCMGEDCILWDRNKDNCLIRLSLLQAVSMGFPVMNFGNTIDKDWSGLQGGL